MFDLVIKNANVVSPDAIIFCSIGINNGKIRELSNSSLEGKTIIDAQNNYVLPGGIEAHMHCRAPFQGCLGAHTFYEQSKVAAFGGITTFMDFANMSTGQDPYDQVMNRVNEMKESAIDYSVHGKIVEYNENVKKSIKKLVDEGFPSFKMFMTYKKEGVMSSDETILNIFKLSKELGAIPMLHCEGNAIAELNIEKAISEGNTTWKKFAECKPVMCEVEAFDRALNFAKYIGNAIIIVHTTNGICLDSARRAHEELFPVYVETGPHYLTLFDNLYEGEDGYLAICSPPLRTPKEAEELWKGLEDGTINLVGSDDCTFDYDEKTMFLKRDKDGNFIQDFTKVVNGMGGIETRLPILLSEGVNKGRLSINQVCALTSTNIAKLYGCYPQKGIIAPGADADLTILDMSRVVPMTKENLHSKIHYSLYQDIVATGWPITTISRGKVIVENGEFKGEKGRGQLVPCKINSCYLNKYSGI